MRQITNYLSLENTIYVISNNKGFIMLLKETNNKKISLKAFKRKSKGNKISAVLL